MQPRRTRLPILAPVLPAALLCGACVASAHRPQTELAIAAAVGFDQAVELRVESPLSESEGAASGRLPLEEALRRALGGDPGLQAALARVELALAEADQARLLANPLLTLVVRFPEGGGAADVEAGLSQDLLSFLGRGRRIDAADERLRAAVAEAVRTSLDVVSALRERYAAVQALDELVPLLEERRTTLARLVELARARLAAGEAARLDVTSLETRAVELELEIEERRAQRTDAHLELARALGLPLAQPEWELEPWPAPVAELGDERAWIATALARRPELEVLRRELAALEAEAARAGVAGLEGSTLGLEAERDGEWSVGPGASVPLPLFDLGGSRRARARAEVLGARHALVAAERDVVSEVRRAWAGLRSAQNALARVRDELIPLQRERREQVEAVYLGGEVDVTAVLLAEQDLQASQVQLVEFEQRASLSLVRLERAVGGAGVAPHTALAENGGAR